MSRNAREQLGHWFQEIALYRVAAHRPVNEYFEVSSKQFRTKFGRPRTMLF
jgi:hypothetical protein